MSKYIMKTLITVIFSLTLFTVNAQQPGLLISEVFPNPAGTDDNQEFVELTATKAIDFSLNPYTVVFSDGSNATAANGWKTGSNGSYAIEINTGTVVAGDKVYVGGNAFVINGATCKKIQKNTTTTGGDGGIGTGASAGILGNGGANADGVAVFSLAAASITNASVPVDAIFFGTGVGNATGKFIVPTNDRYDNAQGKYGVGTNTFTAPDPGANYLTATGEFNISSFTWITARTWSSPSNIPNCNTASGILLTLPNNLSLTVNTASTTPYLSLPDISGVAADATDPAANSGVVFIIKDNGVDIPAANYNFTASSSNTSVVSNANVLITKANGSATVKIIPSAAGYSTISLTLEKSGLTKTYVINYAASVQGTNSGSNTRYHTSNSDASTVIAQDDNYMMIADDEQNKLLVLSRSNSGLPLKSFDYSGLLNLTDLSGGVPREVDVEASAKGITNPNRVFWLGSMSNKSSSAPYSSRPNRNRIFATDYVGTGASTVFSYVGDYENLRSNIITWGDANGFNLSASAADGMDPKLIDGFNAEGMCFAPDNTTLYIAFRAPLLPVSNRTKALIVPVLNFETWFGNGSPAGSPTFGSPILIDLNGWGIRSIDKLSNNKYVIIAGNYDDGPFSGAVFTWNGSSSDAPVVQAGFDLAGLSPEGFLQVNSGGNIVNNQLQMISDNGAYVYYNDGIAAKDLGINNFKKFRSDIVTSLGVPLPVIFNSFDLFTRNGNDVFLQWSCSGIDEVSFFEIQRAKAGDGYQTIARLQISNTFSYSFTDPNLATGNYEYRIRVVHKNGEIHYSNIRLAKIGSANDYVSVYPNPVIDGIVHIAVRKEGEKSVSISDAAGSVVYKNTFKGSQLDILINELPAGIYFVRIQGSGFSENVKLVKR